MYWAAEGLEPGALNDMEMTWEDVQMISCDGHVMRRTYPDHFGIDDWYHPVIGQRITELCKQRHFDVCVVNYVWLSKTLMWLPDDCIKIIDTHDLFGGRAEKFTSIGRKPEWYYTSVEEETRGLDRADFVVAIQSDEALELKERTRSEVVEVGYLLPPSPVRRRRAEDDDAISLGYIGSANPFNVASVSHFCEVLSGRTLPQDVRLLASGSICDLLKTMPRQPFTLLGRVKHLDEFYESIDVAINPMTGGTGLKIKTIEALSHGVAVVGTAEAFAGIETTEEAHQFVTIEGMVDYLQGLSRDPQAVQELRQKSIRLFNDYTNLHQGYFLNLYRKILALKQVRAARPESAKA